MSMEVDQDAEMPSSSSGSKGEKKRFEVKKWNATEINELLKSHGFE